jgi:anaerobic selenocysteine-containing dehydrogenase
MTSDPNFIAPSGQPWQVTELKSFPPPEKWDDWVEYDSKAWPRKVEKRFRLVPTICFNCEAACGLVAYVERSTNTIRKLEGNPYHPGSRGRNCAKGPATLNQINDPQRILYPLKRSGPRGSGQFERTTWDEVIATFAARIRKALVENRRTEVMYHVGRPGHDGYMDRVLQSWGVDGHNSHTNVCSAAARLGYALWSGVDRPSPDHANAKFILLISSHLEAGHYFNPHAQRIIEGKMAGAKIATVDIRLSNTASMSDWWIAPRPGTEAALLLGIAKVMLDEDLFDRDFVRRWVNWKTALAGAEPGTNPSDDAARSARPGGSVPGSAAHAGSAGDRGAGFVPGSAPPPAAATAAAETFDDFVAAMRTHYARFTPDWVAAECGIDAAMVTTLAREIGKARGAFAAHVWRSAASAHKGGWQVARCLEFLCVLSGSVGTKGGTGLNAHNKFVAAPFDKPPPQDVWNELLYPPEWPLSHHELSFLLPHLLRETGRRVDVYFTRVYNPVWTNPDGFTWMGALKDESMFGLHAALTPTWSETAMLADYVLPMGMASERHDLMSQETHAGKWIGFRQPVLRVLKERDGEKVEWTWQANPGEVWEEDEFWIALSWAIDPDGSLGVRKHFESPYRPGERISVEEYYRWIFEHSVPGLPEAAAKLGLTPLEYMRRHGCFEVAKDVYETHAKPVDVTGAVRDAAGRWIKDGAAIAIDVDGVARAGFATPSRKLELFSPTMAEWGFGDNAMPAYIESHLHETKLDRAKGEMVLCPTFRLPTLIHTRSGNSKWLNELSNANPVWMHPTDAARLGVATGDLLRLSTRIGHFVNRAWVTEGIRPGVVACSHHLGRWRIEGQPGTDKWAAAPVRIETEGTKRRIRRVGDLGPFASSDPDSKRVWWTDGGVHQNLTFAVQPDPISGMHCWHQKVVVEKARPDDRYGDVEVDTSKSMEAFREWKALATPLPRADGLRRPLWFARAVKPTKSAYYRG